MRRSERVLWILGFVLIFGIGAKIIDNTLRVGDGNSATDKSVLMGDGVLKWDGGDAKLQFSNDDGSNFADIGSGAGGGTGGVNILGDENSDFELSDPPSLWTKSGAGSFIAELGSPGFGDQSGQWDPSATSENLDSELIAVPVGLENRNCSAVIQYTWPTGVSGEIKMQVLDSGSLVLAEKDMDPSSDWREDFLIFSCPSSEQIRLRFLSTADAAVITLDNAHLGSNIKEFQISNAEYYGGLEWDAVVSCLWFSGAGATFNTFPLDNDCLDPTEIGKVTKPATKVPEIELIDAPPGNYYISMIGTRLTNSAANSGVGACRLIDDAGTIIAVTHWNFPADTAQTASLNLTGNIKYTVSGNHTIRPQCFHASASGIELNLGIFAAGTESKLVAGVWRYPLDTETAFNLNNQGWHVDVEIGGANPSLNTSSIAYTRMANSGLDMVIRPGSQPAEIPCNTVTPSEGLTCNIAAVAETLGVSFTPPFAGKFEVCAEFPIQVNPNASSEVIHTFQLFETPNNDDATLTQAGGSTARVDTSTGTSSHKRGTAIHLCGMFEFNSVSKKTVRLFHETSLAGGSISLAIVAINRGAAEGEPVARFTVRAVTQGHPLPVIFNTVSTSGQAGLRIEAADIEFVATVPGVNVEFGDWIDSVSDEGVGRFDLVIKAGVFAAPPVCFCIFSNAGGDVACGTGFVSHTTTAAVFEVFNTVTGNATDDPVSIVCMAPKG